MSSSWGGPWPCHQHESHFAEETLAQRGWAAAPRWLSAQAAESGFKLGEAGGWRAGHRPTLASLRVSGAGGEGLLCPHLCPPHGAPTAAHTSKVTTTPPPYPRARGAPAPHDENTPTYTQADERTQSTKLRSDTHRQAPKAGALPHGLPHGPHPSGCTPTPASSPSHMSSPGTPHPQGAQKGGAMGRPCVGKILEAPGPGQSPGSPHLTTTPFRDPRAWPRQPTGASPGSRKWASRDLTSSTGPEPGASSSEP